MTKSTITREESVQAVFDLKVGYTLELADIEILKRVARMALAELQAKPVTTANKLGNSQIIGFDPASGPDRTVEVRYVAPPGYVMVPKEPTGKQWSAGVQAFDSGMDKVTRIYKAMLAAAPQEVR